VTRGFWQGQKKKRRDKSRSLRDDNKKDAPRLSKEIKQEDRPTGPYIEALVNPS
jgi:hypothetical protein